jgi:transposase
VLVDRRRSLGEEHTRKIAERHALLLELTPGGAIRLLGEMALIIERLCN